VSTRAAAAAFPLLLVASARVASADEPQPPAAPPPDEVTVRARPRPRTESVEVSVPASEARAVAGAQGDPLKVVQNLPGVARPPLASGQIVVWGSAPSDTRVYVDGVEIPALYHGGAIRSTMSSELVSRIDLVPGAYGAEYGRGLGGLVRVETRDLPSGTHGYVGADTLDGSTWMSTSLGADDRVRVGAGVRYGWLDRLLVATSARDVGDFFPIPRYADGQVKATVDLRKNEMLDLVFLASSDDLDRTVSSPDPAARRTESTRASFWRVYARYTGRTDSGDAVVVTPFVGHDRSALVQSFGGQPASLDVRSDRYGVRTTLRSRLASRFGDAATLTTGLDALGTVSSATRTGSLTLPPREGDIAVFGQPPGDDVASDAWRNHVLDVGPNVTVDLRLGPVTLTPGVRVDAYLLEGSAKTPPVPAQPPIGWSRLESAIDPRGSLRWDVTERFALTAAGGTYHQAPEPADLSAVFGTPALGLSRATHLSAGESLRVGDTLTLDVVAFDKQLEDLVVRTRLPSPLLARALTQNGEGRSYGVQFLLRQEAWHGFFGWASYTISRSLRRFEGDPTWRSFDFDQPHVLALVASQALGPWTFGGRFRYASGDPRTPVLGGAYDARDDRYDPIFGAQNAIRLPAFWQLDLRVERSFALGRGVRAAVYADAENVTGHANAEEFAYSSDYRQRSPITGLPFIAVVGGRVEL
jgi:hypothetical protein